MQLAADVGAPQQLVQNVLGTTALTSMALLDQIPDVAVIRAGVTALMNLAGNMPIAVDEAINLLAAGDLFGAVQVIGGVVLNSAVGFATGAISDVVEVVSAVSLLLPQMFTNLGIAIPAALELAFQGQLGEALSTLLGPVLSAVGGIAGVAIPGLLPIVGAASSLIPQMFTNLAIAVPAAIELVFQGKLVSALQTVVGPVFSAAGGIVGVAIPGLFPALNAASILLPQVIPNLAIAIPEALRLATELKLVSALNALLSPVFNAVAGIASAALGPQEEEVPEDEFLEGPVSEFAAVQVASDSITATAFADPASKQTLTLDLDAPAAAELEPAPGEVLVTEPEAEAEEVVDTETTDETVDAATETDTAEPETETGETDTTDEDSTEDEAEQEESEEAESESESSETDDSGDSDSDSDS